MKDKPHKIPSKEDILLTSLRMYYTNHPTHLQQFIDVFDKTTCISLRLLDWLVTNYAKKHNISYLSPDGTIFNIYREYKAQLKAHSKKLFDPFNRRSRIVFNVCNDSDDRKIETTLGQLNFFRWAINTGVLSYCVQHATEIEKDMMKIINDRKLVECENKRKELSRAKIRGVTFTELPQRVLVKF